MRTFALSLGVCWLLAGTALAAEPCQAPAACSEVQTCGAAHHCGHCGCACQCTKCCQVVCEMKEVKKTVWVVKCEDFCAPLPNCSCGHHGCKGDTGACCAEASCCQDGCKKCDPCAFEKSKCCVPPKCGKVRTKKVLEAKTVVCTVPCYKCVVVYMCPNCAGNGNCDAQTPSVPAKSPAPPPAPNRTTERAPLPSDVDTSLTK
jgi:hypothetical protein